MSPDGAGHCPAISFSKVPGSHRNRQATLRQDPSPVQAAGHWRGCENHHSEHSHVVVQASAQTGQQFAHRRHVCTDRYTQAGYYHGSKHKSWDSPDSERDVSGTISSPVARQASANCWTSGSRNGQDFTFPQAGHTPLQTQRHSRPQGPDVAHPTEPRNRLRRQYPEPISASLGCCDVRSEAGEE